MTHGRRISLLLLFDSYQERRCFRVKFIACGGQQAVGGLFAAHSGFWILTPDSCLGQRQLSRLNL
jgi:hypothetical protein